MQMRTVVVSSNNLVSFCSKEAKSVFTHSFDGTSIPSPRLSNCMQNARQFHYFLSTTAHISQEIAYHLSGFFLSFFFLKKAGTSFFDVLMNES